MEFISLEERVSMESDYEYYDYDSDEVCDYATDDEGDQSATKIGLSLPSISKSIVLDGTWTKMDEDTTAPEHSPLCKVFNSGAVILLPKGNANRYPMNRDSRTSTWYYGEPQYEVGTVGVFYNREGTYYKYLSAVMSSSGKWEYILPTTGVTTPIDLSTWELVRVQYTPTTNS